MDKRDSDKTLATAGIVIGAVGLATTITAYFATSKTFDQQGVQLQRRCAQAPRAVIVPVIGAHESGFRKSSDGSKRATGPGTAFRSRRVGDDLQLACFGSIGGAARIGPPREDDRVALPRIAPRLGNGVTGAPDVLHARSAASTTAKPNPPQRTRAREHAASLRGASRSELAGGPPREKRPGLGSASPGFDALGCVNELPRFHIEDGDLGHGVVGLVAPASFGRGYGAQHQEADFACIRLGDSSAASSPPACHFLPARHRPIGTKDRNCQRPPLERDERQPIAHRGHQHVVGCAGERRLGKGHRAKLGRRGIGDIAVRPRHDARLTFDIARQERAVPTADQCDLRLRRKLWPWESDVCRRAEGT